MDLSALNVAVIKAYNYVAVNCMAAVIVINKRRLHHPSHPFTSLLKCFWAIYFIGSDKGNISALRLSKLIEVNWKTTRSILSKVRTAMGHKDSLYRLQCTIELDDAFIRGKHQGK